MSGSIVSVINFSAWGVNKNISRTKNCHPRSTVSCHVERYIHILADFNIVHPTLRLVHDMTALASPFRDSPDYIARETFSRIISERCKRLHSVCFLRFRIFIVRYPSTG